MRLPHCPACHERLFFEQSQCSQCNTHLVFDVGRQGLLPLPDAAACANRSLIGCNWPARHDDKYCLSCSLTRTIPNLDAPRNVQLWRRVEQAKRRLVCDLCRLKLPLGGGGRRIAFDILSDETAGQPVTTGHLNGLITLSLSEADDAEREARREAFREPYRTLLGHFRHEVGHFYFDILVDQIRLKKSFRLIFGDETLDYAEALNDYHARTERAYDRSCFISEYASSHPCEDWAESFAHFLHIMSTLDSAAALPLALGERSRQTLADPYLERDFDALLSSWAPVAYTMNELNRSMGLGDAYPFELSQAVRGKLHFVHMVILNFRHRAGKRRRQGPRASPACVEPVDACGCQPGVLYSHR